MAAAASEARAASSRPQADARSDVLQSEELLALVLGHLSALQAQRPAQLVSKRWRRVCLELHRRAGYAPRLIVTIAAENSVVVLDGAGAVVQRFTPMPPRRRRGAAAAGRSASSWRTAHWESKHEWPTCLAFGPEVGR